MASIYLVRHGQASFGTHDYDRLSSLGVRQAQRAGCYLNQVTGNAARVVSGTLLRQRDTAAEIIEALSASRSDLPELQIDSRFDEVDLDTQVTHFVPQLSDPNGELAALITEARASSRAYQKLIRRVFLQWQACGEPLPALETWAAFTARIGSALNDLMLTSRSGENTIVVSSGAVIATLVHRVLDLPRESAYGLFEVMMNCSVTHLLHDRQRVSLSSFNECSYLVGGGPERDALSTELLTYR